MDYSRAEFPRTTPFSPLMDDYSSTFDAEDWYEVEDTEMLLHSLPTPPVDWPCDAAELPTSPSSTLGQVFQPFASMGKVYDPESYVLEPTPYRFPSPAGSCGRESLSESDAPHYSLPSPFSNDSPPIATLPLPPTYSWDHLLQPVPKREASGSVPALADPIRRPKSSRSALFTVHRDGAARPRATPTVPSVRPPVVSLTQVASTKPKACPTFATKLAHLLHNPDMYSDVISWNEAGDAFLFHNTDRLRLDVFDSIFAHSSLTVFTRQLATYGFHHLTSEEVWEAFALDWAKGRGMQAWSHPHFTRDDQSTLHLLYPIPSRARAQGKVDRAKNSELGAKGSKGRPKAVGKNKSYSTKSTSKASPSMEPTAGVRGGNQALPENLTTV